MARNELVSETPATIANRLYNLILSFPSAAAGGVEWKVLVRTYNELNSTQLDIAALGHSSPLVAAIVLLGDALRLVDKNETNPVVALEDWAAMTVQPGAPATWPSLYKSLCEIVSEHGSKEVAGHGTSFVVLVSMLKPWLVRHWHSNFDETSLSYITKQGKRVRVKKMKHLLRALVEWREERVAWRAEGRTTGCSELDQVLEPQLELLVSKEHNDMLLRCLLPTSSPAGNVSSSPAPQVFDQSDASADRDAGTCASSNGSAELLCEIASLRAENANLRSQNSALGQQTNRELLQKQTIESTPQSQTQAHDLSIDVWDSPFEPPPFVYCGSSEATPRGSTALPSEFGFCSGSATPCTMASSSQTVPATPTAYTTWAWDGTNGQLCSMVPIWHVIGDISLIPNGVVQQALTKFESHKVLPSFFTANCGFP